MFNVGQFKSHANNEAHGEKLQINHTATLTEMKLKKINLDQATRTVTLLDSRAVGSSLEVIEA